MARCWFCFWMAFNHKAPLLEILLTWRLQLGCCRAREIQALQLDPAAWPWCGTLPCGLGKWSASYPWRLVLSSWFFQMVKR